MLVVLFAIALGSCRQPNVVLSFPDFPQRVAVVNLGEELIIDVASANDGGLGVTWSCKGGACSPFVSVSTTSVRFRAVGLSGVAIVTATARRQPEVKLSLAVTVNLNDTPDLLCVLRVPQDRRPG